ncbi:tryptophan--tRNA ligase [Arcobacter sp. FWKO B]|uniref:tryptophan--tRNA ligase n=1 Tax=Arcobacter sp. FWKO B TaxID=2593672 RepID=UPI0018A58EDA|nr:tryptophan--tRNA ligase [Arcobacter sp. FWKO B]QOG12700.1 tryptophan--tRNA ligase [Arcobacter sp. FWKO B]
MRILSGIQPSGTLHIGNYFGMIKKMVESQDDGELFAFIASYHALTSLKDSEALKSNIFEAAVNFLSLGLDPNKSTFWSQSDVPEVLELYWLLSNHTSMGLLERAHSYKDKVAKGILANHGLFSYPVLMAADILLYDSDIVPVGKDQVQHVEITRDIANTFNVTYNKEILKLPVAKVDEVVATVLGTDGAKMSKSYGNTIDLFAAPKKLKKQVMGIVTDSTPLEEPKDYTNCNVYNLCKLFMNEDELRVLRDKYATPNMGYGHFKLDLLEAITKYFEPFQEKKDFYTQNPDIVKDILSDGAKKARIIAKAKLEILREIVGLKI